MFRIAALVVMGCIVGLSARVLLPGKAPGGFLTTMLVGVGGALLAALVGRLIGIWHSGDAPGFFLSLGGAVVLLAAYRAYTSRTT